MRYTLLILLVFTTFSGIVFADEILLKNGKAWINVNILENEETEFDIIIFTSMQKKIIIDKNEIAGIKRKPFDTGKKSEFIQLTEENQRSFPVFGSDSVRENEPYIENPSNAQRSSSIKDSLLIGLPKMRLNVEGGYSYRTVKIPAGTSSEMESYLGGLKSGSNFSMDLTYFIHKEFGITMTYSRFSASNSLANIEFYDQSTNETFVGSMEDNMIFSYVGVGVSQRRLYGNGSGLFIANLALGKLSYNNDSRVVNFPFDIEGSTIALHGLIGLEFFLSKEFGLGGSISYVLGSLGQIKVNGNEIPLSENENLNRFDFNIGLKYYF